MNEQMQLNGGRRVAGDSGSAATSRVGDQRSWLASLLARRPRLLARLAAHYARLRQLPRWTRRQLQRRVAVGLAGAVLLLALGRGPVGSGVVHAANIDVDEGLTTKHDINAIHMNAADDLYISFFQNKIMTADVGNVFGHDILHFDGDEFGFFFDGSDVGLTTTAEKIDGLHILDGSVSPIGGSCEAYLLISTLGTGKVPASSGGILNFQGEDVLGFCATSLGTTTAGLWHLVVDGSDYGMPKNSTDSISASDDGSVIYLTTKGTFNVDSAAGGHSMVYQFEGGSFSGPFFSAPANGLNEKVDGLHVGGDLP